MKLTSGVGFMFPAAVMLLLSASSEVLGQPPNLPNLDLRTSEEKPAVRDLERLRDAQTMPGASLASSQVGMDRAIDSLAARVSNLEVIRSIETGGAKESLARTFVETYSELWGLSLGQAADLETDADYTNPDGDLSWVRLKQRIHGLPVFRGELTVAFTPQAEIFRTMGQLAAAVPESLAPPSPELLPEQAVVATAQHLRVTTEVREFTQLSANPEATSLVLAGGPFAADTNIDLVYFPLGPGAVELAWSMILWGDIDAYYVVVSAEDGTLLFRKNITEYLSHSYRVYTSDSPAPLTPGPIDPALGTQGDKVAAQLVTIDSLLPGDPWLAGCSPPPCSDVTAGNNVVAGLDLVAPDGVDAPVPAATAAR